MEECIETSNIKTLQQTIAKIKNKTGFTDVILDTDDLHFLNDYAVSMDITPKGYQAINIQHKGIRKRLSHVLLGLESLPKGFVVDHCDKNPLNMSKQNLRLVPFSVNTQNKSKKIGTTSKYIGVSWNKQLQCWRTQSQIAGKIHYLGSFTKENEIEAAKAYDRFIIFMYQNVKMSTNSTLSEDEITAALKTKPKLEKRTISDLGVGIQHVYHKFVYTWCEEGKEFRQSFDTFEHANSFREQKIEEKKQSKKKKALAQGIRRNSDGIPIILTNIRAGTKHEIMVDEKFYFEVAQYNWNFQGSRITATVEGKIVNLPFFVLTLFGFEKKDKQSIDHVEQNFHDCRVKSLRFVDISAQIQNRRKLKPGSSKYIGVSQQINKTADTTWKVSIELRGKMVFRQLFSSEKEAAEHYNIEVQKYYENPKLNVINNEHDNNANEVTKANTDVIVKKTHIRGKKGNSLYRGVSKAGKMWKASFRFNNRVVYSKSFVTKEEAALAYNIEICKYYTHPELNVVPLQTNKDIVALKDDEMFDNDESAATDDEIADEVSISDDEMIHEASVSDDGIGDELFDTSLSIKKRKRNH